MPYAGPALEPGTSYEWTVRTWDEDGEVSGWAAPARFDTGLGDGDWSGASWIRRTTTGNDSADDYTLARKEVAIGDSQVTRARAYVSAMGQYELRVNGRHLYRGDSFGYPGEGQYSATDITAAVRAGRPLALGVLYHYWTCTCQGRANGPAGDPLKGPSGLLVKVVVDHADGSRETIVSDGSWKVAKAAEYTNDDADPPQRRRRRLARALRRARRAGRLGHAPASTTPRGRRPPSSARTRARWRRCATRSRTSTRSISDLALREVQPGDASRDSPTAAIVADFGNVMPAMPQVGSRTGVAGRAARRCRRASGSTTRRSPRPRPPVTPTIKVARVAEFVAGDQMTVDRRPTATARAIPRSARSQPSAATAIALDRAARARPRRTDAWVEGSRAGTAGHDTQGTNLGWWYTEKDGAQTAQRLHVLGLALPADRRRRRGRSTAATSRRRPAQRGVRRAGARRSTATTRRSTPSST